MLKIKTIKDIKRIRKQELLPLVLVEELERYFKEICHSITGDDEVWKTCSIAKHGPILILEQGKDDPNNITEHSIGSIFDAPIEFTNKITLDGMELFQTVLVLNNSFCLVIYIEKAKFGNELDEYLSQYLVEW